MIIVLLHRDSDDDEKTTEKRMRGSFALRVFATFPMAIHNIVHTHIHMSGMATNLMCSYMYSQWAARVNKCIIYTRVELAE